MSATVLTPAIAAAPRDVQRHPLLRRLAHWSLVLAIVIMLGSGWRIYNDVPILPFQFPLWATLGGNPDASYARHNESGTANAIAWHLAGMWLLLFGFLLYVIHSAATRHLTRDLLPVSPRAFLRDFTAAATFRLSHRLGEYNMVQRVFYWGVLFAMAMMFLTGLAIWKPVQLYPLTFLFGGFDIARVVHFFFMASIVGFMAIHVALVVLVPKTLVAMVTGEASAPAHSPAHGPSRRPVQEDRR